MNMQSQNPNKSQKPRIPQVRYHPTIQTQTPEARATTSKIGTGNKQKGKPGARCPPLSGWEGGDSTLQVEPVPVVTPGSNGGTKQKASSQKPINKSNQKQDQGAVTDPDPPQKVVHMIQKGPPKPEQIPLGLGVRLDTSVVEKVELLTRGQRQNEDWFSWRKNRITASVAHRIAHCQFVHGKSRTPPRSYLDAVTGEGPRFQTRALSWGVKMEAEAVRRYQSLKSSALGRPVSVLDCGLFVDPLHPWLAASPDGIVTDSQTSQRLLCLEVKCPYKHRNKRVEEACRDPSFCLQIQEGKDGQGSEKSPFYRLKPSHSYFTQIQCQLAVTGLSCADLVVFTLEETAIIPVTFDPKLWEETLSKLQVFYREAVLPKLREQTGAWTPEQ